MNGLWRRLHDALGGVALIALGLLAAGLVFLTLVVRPLESRLQQLDALSNVAARQAAGASRRSTPSAKLAAFYAYFERQEGQIDWLAKLYGNARAAGLEWRTADYRLVDTKGRIARYEILLPLSGTYAHLRAFLEQVLEENPVLSLDQLSLRRKRVNDTVLEAEIVLSIHLLRP